MDYHVAHGVKLYLEQFLLILLLLLERICLCSGALCSGVTPSKCSGDHAVLANKSGYPICSSLSVELSFLQANTDSEHFLLIEKFSMFYCMCVYVKMLFIFG